MGRFGDSSVGVVVVQKYKSLLKCHLQDQGTRIIQRSVRVLQDLKGLEI